MVAYPFEFDLINEFLNNLPTGSQNQKPILMRRIKVPVSMKIWWGMMMIDGAEGKELAEENNPLPPLVWMNSNNFPPNCFNCHNIFWPNFSSVLGAHLIAHFKFEGELCKTSAFISYYPKRTRRHQQQQQDGNGTQTIMIDRFFRVLVLLNNDQRMPFAWRFWW